eukprot:c29061_g1_i2 orf=359-2782(-)
MPLTSVSRFPCCCVLSKSDVAMPSECVAQHLNSVSRCYTVSFRRENAEVGMDCSSDVRNFTGMTAIQKLDNGPFCFRGLNLCGLGYQKFQKSVQKQIKVPFCVKLHGQSLKRYLQVHAETGNVTRRGDDVEQSIQVTVEQSKKILTLQKELLKQIDERKILITTLEDNHGNSGEQLKTFDERDSLKNNESLEFPLRNGEFQSCKSLTDREFSLAKSSLMPQNPATPATALACQSTISHAQESAFQLPLTNSSIVSTSALDFMPKLQRPVDTRKKLALVVEETGEEPEKIESLKLEEDAAAEEIKEKPAPLAGVNVMNVIVVAAECAPWSKTGGLADVVGALPKALARRGHRVMVVAPRYANYEEAWNTGVRKRHTVAGQDLEVTYFHGYIDGVDYVFVDNWMFHSVANNIYGGSRQDVLKRMILLCKSAVEAQWHVPCGGVSYGDNNLVFIANDWHTSLLPVYLKAYYRDHGVMQYTRCILVIHNIAHQGRGPLSDFNFLGLPDHYLDKFKLNDYIGGQHFNAFMGGIIAAHRIVAVSDSYSRECQMQEGGWGLDRVIRENSWKLRGIPNGIDDKEWNSEVDIFLQSDGYVNYTIDTLETGKAACKAALQKELGLPVRSDVPVLGFVGRLDKQKGVDIIAEAMQWMMEQDLQLILLGSGQRDLENMLRSLERQYRDKVRGWVGFSVKTAHRITAGADILLMPSRFEPCGLNQLYAMQYGTVPVVHAVGGLRDTIRSFDPYANTGTGWTFDRASSSAMIHALGNAIWTYRDFKESWLGIQKRGMAQDLSWDKSAKQYEEVLVAAKYQW